MVMNRAQKRQRLMNQFLVGGNGMQPMMMQQPAMAPTMMQPSMMMHPQQQMVMQQQPMAMQPQPMGMQPHPMGMQAMAMQPMMHPQQQQQALQAMVDEDDDNVEDDLVEDQEFHQPAGMAAPAPGPAAPPVSVGLPYNTGDDAAISRSSSLLRGLPRRRLTVALERLNAEVDAGFLSEVSQKGLLILLRLFTRLRPSTKITHLRALLYSNQMFLI